MTTLNSRLQLALLNRKKGRNLIEKGFTLVELMIVIVIVGILSAVALPNFLSQTAKAKATECTSKVGAILSQVAAEHQLDPDDAAVFLTNEVGAANADSENCTFIDAGLIAPAYGVNVTGADQLLNKYAAKSCVDADSGKRDIKSKTGDPVTLGDVAAAVCA
ncbi:type IV pilin protein [Synechococcus sp. A10-1-5-9]|uniref:type IV pilin protein n=1 Tax=Synechococcus sp. A10-1-5-9 TaxID=3392295 RepID=UPI0039EA4D2A